MEKHRRLTQACNKGRSSKSRDETQASLKWQTGAYERHADFRFTLPYQFLLLCRLMDITPDQVLTDFMDNLSCGSWQREGRDKAKEKLIDYFVEHGYGQHNYAPEDIRSIFRELDAIGFLCPEGAKSKMIDQHAQWRDKYHTYWFKKWFSKSRRKL